MIIPIRNIDINITLPDESVEVFSLQAPNGADPYHFDIDPVIIRDAYRDANMVFRKALEMYECRFIYRYNWHDMDLRKLMIATKIELKAPPGFDGDYGEYDVLLANERVAKNWLGGMVMGSSAKTVRSGSVTLEFQTPEPISAEQLLQLTRWDS